MLRRIILITFLAIITCFSAHAEVFTVTNNADSGPGTLREALTKAAANGTTEKDFIYFNLPDLSEAGRTITLNTQLPDISSNLVIDGSTQPGAKYGVSGSNIQLYYAVMPNGPLSGLRAKEQTDIEIYGLYIKGGAAGDKSYSGYWIGLDLVNNKRVQIGAANKGNVVAGFGYSFSVNFPDNTFKYFEDLTIKGNIFGLEADGKTLPGLRSFSININVVVEKIIIGGTEVEGNVFADGLFIYQGNNGNYEDTGPSEHYASAEATLLLKNNKIGVDYFAEGNIPNSNGFSLATGQPGGKTTASIEDNIIASDQRDAVYIINNGRKVTILRNFIGTDKSRQKKFTVAGNGVFTYWATEVAIGSNNVGDANYITNCNPVWIWPFSYVAVNKNSFYCTKNDMPMNFDSWNSVPPPVVKITQITAASVSGTATPNSSIELFYSDRCGTCSPETYFGSATADAAGNWTYYGVVTGSVIASATSGKSTSNFTKADIDVSKIIVIDACNGKGSIIGAVASNVQTVSWVDEQGNTVSNKPDLVNAKPGKYKLTATNGDCIAATGFYEIVEGFDIVTTAINVKGTPCGTSAGKITGLSIVNHTGTQVLLSWKDETGKEWSTQADLNNLPSGKYTLTATTANGACVKTYGPVAINIDSSPTLNETAATTTTTPCGQSTGSVTGIKVGPSDRTYYYSWKDRSNAEVANTPDLVNKPAGFYKLVITDGTPCGIVTSAEYEIKEINGITIDISKARGQSDRCGLHNAGVTVPVTGATSYQWRNLDDGTIAGTGMNLANVKAGHYRLTATNSFCSKTATFTLRADDAVVFPNFSYETKGSCADRATGSVTVNTGTDPAFQPAYYIWEDASGKVVGTDKSAINLLPGKYRLTLIDNNGCRNFYREYTVPAYEKLSFAQYGTVNHIKCGLGTGSVTATIWKGGSGTFSYQWYDANEQPMAGKTANFIDGIPAGKYRLHLTDDEGCTPGDITYEIRDDQQTPNIPVVTNIDVCEKGPAVIRVVDPYSTAIYRLYDSPTSTTVLDEKVDGIFKINITETRSYYVALTYGECESDRAEVKVSLGDISGKIANTFTPNADGRNDFWQIPGIENYTNGVVSIFSREGQLVYQSRGYANPFDGTYKGKQLPPGVYYYVIDLKRCNLVSGHLTIIR